MKKWPLSRRVPSLEGSVDSVLKLVTWLGTVVSRKLINHRKECVHVDIVEDDAWTIGAGSCLRKDRIGHPIGLLDVGPKQPISDLTKALALNYSGGRVRVHFNLSVVSYTLNVFKVLV
jgi:hypothetical protein